MSINYHQLIEKQRSFFATGKTKDIAFRIEQLTCLRSSILRNYPKVTKALNQDLRKSEFEAFGAEVTGALDELNAAIKYLDSWTQPLEAGTPPPFGEAQSRIYYEPFGCALILSTWNYPFVLCMKALIGALAAGNCCLLKPSEIAPHSANVIAEIVNDCFDEAYCTAVVCDVMETTAILAERFDIIHYTGNTRVGKIVARAAANHLTPVILELGGKSPCIVDKTADIESSVDSICSGKFLNAGQTCVAPDYLLVHKEVKDQLIAALQKQIKLFYGDNIQSNPDLGRIINIAHFDRLQSLLGEGRLLTGGHTDKAQLYIEPTLIDGIGWNSRIMQEEVFGPIFPIIVYDDIEEVIRQLARREKPLALYLYSTDEALQQRIIHDVSFGGGCINATILHMLNPHLPFGGVGNSGLGSYNGRWSIESFSHKKGVLNKTLTNEPSMFSPPYADHVEILKQIYLQN
ncbi:MAG: aldehyde dehydrogenase family protein [Tannerella sp.]|jgi:aldehyde dehydrogenase (NAD+)|nr:aldehyde dehydrogenase family protein [Tannerella sp.]